MFKVHKKSQVKQKSGKEAQKSSTNETEGVGEASSKGRGILAASYSSASFSHAHNLI